MKQKDWLATMPAAVCKTWAAEATTLAEAINLAELELELIAEGQEAAEYYTKREVGVIRRWVAKAKGGTA